MDLLLLVAGAASSLIFAEVPELIMRDGDSVLQLTFDEANNGFLALNGTTLLQSESEGLTVTVPIIADTVHLTASRLRLWKLESVLNAAGLQARCQAVCKTALCNNLSPKLVLRQGERVDFNLAGLLTLASQTLFRIDAYIDYVDRWTPDYDLVVRFGDRTVARRVIDSCGKNAFRNRCLYRGVDACGGPFPDSLGQKLSFGISRAEIENVSQAADGEKLFVLSFSLEPNQNPKLNSQFFLAISYVLIYSIRLE